MSRKSKKDRRRIFTPEELANDPSLKWCSYRPWETIWSDRHQAELRFVRYDGEEVVLGTLGGMAELPGTVPALSIRRLTAR